MGLTTSQIDALKRVLGDGALRVATRLRRDSASVRAVLERAASFIGEAHGHVKGVFSLRVDFGASGSVPISAASVIAGLASNLTRYRVDEQLRLLGTSAESVDDIAVSDRSDLENSLEILVSPDGVARAYVCGRLDASLHLKDCGVQAGASGWYRPIRDFALLLRDQFEHAVAKESQFAYWKDRKKRLLISQGKTEKIFHHHLFWWLRMFTSDAVAVVGEAQGMGQDKTDITIITGAGSVVIEVKWLGKNDANNGYGNPPRVNEGLEQVKIYLDNDRSLVCGHLVVYDARAKAVHDTGCGYQEKYRHALCQKPHILFLDSDTPSTMAHAHVAAASAGASQVVQTKPRKAAASASKKKKKKVI